MFSFSSAEGKCFRPFVKTKQSCISLLPHLLQCSMIIIYNNEKTLINFIGREL